MSADEVRTVEGTSWPIVLFVELTGDRAKAWSKSLEEANIIVLSEASILRAAMVVTSERPHVVVMSAALPLERTQVVREAAKDVGAELLSLRTDMSPADLRPFVENAIRGVMARRASPRPPRA